MKKIICLALLFIGIVQTYSQTDSLYYLNKNGDKIYYHYNDCNKLQEGKLFCIECFNEETHEKEIRFKARFKSIEETEYHGIYIAMGSNRLYGLIDINGDTILDFNYKAIDYPDIAYENYKVKGEIIFTIFTKQGVGIYSLQRGELMPPIYDYFEEDYDFMYTWHGNIKVRKGKKEGYYSLTKRKETIPPIYKSVDHSYELDWDTDTLMVQNTKGKYGLINEDGVIILPIEYDYIDDYSGEYPYVSGVKRMLEISKDKKKGIYAPISGKWLVPTEFTQIEDYLETDNGILCAFITYKKGKMGVYDFFGNELLPTLFDEIQVGGLEYYSELDTVVVYSKLGEKYYASINCGGQNINPIKYDSLGFDIVSGYYGYRYVNSKERVNLFTGISEEVQGDFILEGEFYDIFISNGKFGAKGKMGDILIEPIYESANFMYSRSEVMIGYENGVMYYIYVDSGKRFTEMEW